MQWSLQTYHFFYRPFQDPNHKQFCLKFHDNEQQIQHDNGHHNDHEKHQHHDQHQHHDHDQHQHHDQHHGHDNSDTEDEGNISV